MARQVTIGGERLGSGKKMKAGLKNYERSTFDIGSTWRSTMAAGTLVPFMCEVALPGDTFDIDLQADVLTHPTIGPLFGSYKLQLDVFQIPMRLYNAQLHMNALNIGMKMSEVAIPQVLMYGRPINPTGKSVDIQQINPSCIFSYLGIRGLGQGANPDATVGRKFNAIPYLAYWDIYKNYYANKQEEIGVVIHREPTGGTADIAVAEIKNVGPADIALPIDPTIPYTPVTIQANTNMVIEMTLTSITPTFDPNTICIIRKPTGGSGEYITRHLNTLFNTIEFNPDFGYISFKDPIGPSPATWIFGLNYDIAGVTIVDDDESSDIPPKLQTFPLTNIDEMRMLILQNGTTPVDIYDATLAPYGLPLQKSSTGDPLELKYSLLYNQEGLGIKTYQSDLFNNWISTEWIDGVDGISAITAVSTVGDSFTIDELNLSRKVYDMLNRIAISGGTYKDWIEAVYDQDYHGAIENPMYMGGLIKNVVFQEVVSNSATTEQPLGTLAGRGKLGGMHKGGKVICKVDEPSYIMGIVSLTPYMDYSQGNKWDTNLKTYNDFHKPALDQIGFQELVTDQMAFWDTKTVSAVSTFKSAGKQPAWVNYMTNVDEVKGNFADPTQQMFMVLNRRYEPIQNTEGEMEIADLTTYIDPVKCNYIFADTRRDAQNFWVQIAKNITARRKMSSKVMPNL